MRRKSGGLSWGGLLVLALLVFTMATLANWRSAAAQDQAVDPDVAEAVMASMQETIDGFVAEDVEKISAVTADPFVTIDTEGSIGDRETWLTMPDGVDFTAIDASNVEMVALSPETVLVTALITVHGTYAGQEWSSTEQDSFTYILSDGEWLMASNHATTALSEEEMMAQAIASALSAAPSTVAAGATVVVPSPDGSVSVIQEGNNGFTCVPDDPNTIVTDPLCMDEQSMKMFEAFMGGPEPAYDGMGIMYMLQGTAAASASDPMVMKPAEGEEWVVDGPNIRLVSPDGFDEEMFPVEPTADGPYIMWSGTPFEHLVIPVGNSQTSEVMGGMDE
jgi:hypothetical protein